MEAVLLMLLIVVIIIWTCLRNKPPKADVFVSVKSMQSLGKYDMRSFFMQYKEKLDEAESIIEEKKNSVNGVSTDYRIRVIYTSPAGRKSAYKDIVVQQSDIDTFKNNPSLLMGKGEYNKYIKEQQKEKLGKKQHEYYGRVSQ